MRDINEHFTETAAFIEFVGISRIAKNMAHVVVAGAGIVGVSTAIWLQRAGHTVTLVDREGPAAGTSFGNAGVLAAGALLPVTVPQLWKTAPGMLVDAESPLFIRWSYLPKMLPFLGKYMAHATHKHVNTYSRAMSGLLSDSLQQHQALAEGTGAEQYIEPLDYCFGYETQSAFEKDAYSWRIRSDLGVNYEVCTGEEFSGYDPFYRDRFSVVVRCKNHGKINDPGAYIATLAKHFVDQGGVIDIADVQTIVERNGVACALRTDSGEIAGDAVVLTMGAWSKPVLKKLRLNVAMESERGYHIELINPDAMPKSPMMIAGGKFVVTPMAGRIRCAGLVEFGGLHNPASTAPVDMLKRRINDLLPALQYDEISEWLGHRPAPSDSLPLIGEIPEIKHAYVGMGHQHVGLTGGPKTGQLIAALINKDAPAIDLAPFNPQRYKN